MNLVEAIKVALQSLWANKLRTILTVLGVVIAVATVIAVMTFVSGLNSYVAEKIFNLGADVFIISKQPNVITNVDQYLEGQKRKDIKYEDYQAVLAACTRCKYVGASAFRFNSKVKYNEQSSADSSVRGWTPSMGPIYDLDLDAGRSLSESDVNSAIPVVVIGHDIAENLMAGVDPIGKEIRVDGQMYTVIGVAAPKGKTLGQSQDNWVMMPITSWLKQYGANGNSIKIWAKAYETGPQLDAAIDQARVIMRSRRHDLPGQPDSFEEETNSNLLSIWSNLTGTFFFVTIAIACISLVVGGVVVMNIMLVSVTERTREIGIRKALGAKRRDVLGQFLVESSAMAALGGLIGVVLGVAIAKTVTLFIGMPSSIKLWVVIAGLLVATSVGVFFGVYPAKRAAELDPIEALRSEL